MLVARMTTDLVGSRTCWFSLRDKRLRPNPGLSLRLAGLLRAFRGNVAKLQWPSQAQWSNYGSKYILLAAYRLVS